MSLFRRMHVVDLLMLLLYVRSQLIYIHLFQLFLYDLYYSSW